MQSPRTSAYAYAVLRHSQQQAQVLGAQDDHPIDSTYHWRKKPKSTSIGHTSVVWTQQLQTVSCCKPKAT